MDDKKICPMLNFNSNGVTSVFCIKEECAWWDEERQKCAMAVTTPRR